MLSFEVIQTVGGDESVILGKKRGESVVVVSKRGRNNRGVLAVDEIPDIILDSADGFLDGNIVAQVHFAVSVVVADSGIDLGRQSCKDNVIKSCNIVVNDISE